MAGVRYVLEAMNLSADLSDEPGALHWGELLNFIGQHNWQDPYAVHVLGLHIDDAIRARKEAYELRAVPMQPEAKAS